MAFILSHTGGLVYAVRNSPTVNGKHTRIHLHRVILARVLGIELLPEQTVDHINGDALLNTRCNLRLATRMQNAQNHGLYKSNTSGTAGVKWHKRIQKWVAQINVEHKRIHLGYFTDINDAIAARLAAEREYFGEFAPSLSRGT